MKNLRVKLNTNRNDRKRSSKACSACRCRKVRCDMGKTGSPCTSCRVYNVLCIVPIDRRGKYAKKIVSSLGKEEFEEEALSDPQQNAQEATVDSQLQLGDNLPDQDPQYSIRDNKNPQSSMDPQSPTKMRAVDWSQWLPCYASPLSPSITPQVCKRLYRQGVFDIPDTRVRDELLRSYIQYIHPAVPVLDLERFMMLIDESYEGTEGLSFLLFQGVMFAASAFQTPKNVELEGYSTRREIRKARFEKVLTLYRSGCEDDRIATLQSVLLMTYWDEDHDAKGSCASDFIIVAKSILESIQRCPTDPETQFMCERPELWRRIQWSMYIRDRLIALYTQRPYHIEESKFSVPMLKLSDLKIGPLSTKSCLGEDGSHPAIRDPFIRGIISQISICLSQLCRCASRILDSQSNSDSNGSITQSKHIITGAEILLRDSELKEWQNSLPDLLQWRTSSTSQATTKHEDVIVAFRVMLKGISNLLWHALHATQLESPRCEIPEIYELSKSRVHSSVSEIIDTYRFFRLKRIPYDIPDGQVAMLKTAITFHLYDLESTSPATRQIAIESFQLCAQGLQQIGDTYPSANKVLTSIETATRRKRRTRTSGRIQCYQEDLETLEFDSNAGARYRCSPNDAVSSDEKTISQKIDGFTLPQMSALLSSHFMMTASERSLLQDLTSISTGALHRSLEEIPNVSSYTKSSIPVEYSSHYNIDSPSTSSVVDLDGFEVCDGNEDSYEESFQRLINQNFIF